MMMLARLGKRTATAAMAATIILLLGDAYWMFAEYAIQRWFYRLGATPGHRAAGLPINE
jgi:hypothetical protein